MSENPLDISILKKKFELNVGGDVIFDALLHGGTELRHLRRLVKSVKDFDELYVKMAESEPPPTSLEEDKRP